MHFVRILANPTGRASLCCAAVLACTGCGGDSEASDPKGERPPVAVQVVEVVPTPLPDVVQAVGTLDAPERTTLSAEMDEQIVKLDIPEGSKVEAGQILVELDDARVSASQKRAQARVSASRARMRRLEALKASSVSSQQAYDDAEESLAAALAELEEAEADLAKTRIRAPFSGILGMSQVTPGQYLRSGTPIVELTRVDPLDLLFSVPQEFAGDLAVGQRVVGHASGCRVRFEGSLRAIEPRVDPATRTVQVKARIPNERGELWTGMAARVRVVLREIPQAILIPQESLIRDSGRYYVYVVDADHRVQQRTLELGTFFADRIHISHGLEPGDVVVVNGHQKLRPNSSVQTNAYQPVDNSVLELGWVGPPDGCTG